MIMKKSVFILTIMTFALVTGCKKDKADGIVTDVEGNTYKTITIGGSTIMAENLRTTKFRDGSAISLVGFGDPWAFTTTAAYNNVNGSADNAEMYGRLYNWYVVNDSRGICPTGWHVPSNDEFTTIINALGGSLTAGGKMKETGTDYWNAPNSGATNSSGFSARGAGYINYLGVYKDFKAFAGYWTTMQQAPNHAYFRGFYFDLAETDNYAVDKHTGLLIRSVKD